MEKSNTKVIDNDLVITTSPKSRFAEAVKTVRTNLSFANIDKENKIILVTSCEPGDGKSFISANLAAAYSQEGKRVLIIDCDMRKGRQHKIFEVPNSVNAGYSHLILNYKEDNKGDFNFNNYIIKTEVKNLSIIPCGPIPPNPPELLTSKNNQKVLNKLREMFDIIILDCPPVIGISDTAIMTKYSDKNVLVISNKKTKAELVNRAQRIFSQVNASISGVVLNKISVKGTRYGGYYSDSYYGDK